MKLLPFIAAVFFTLPLFSQQPPGPFIITEAISTDSSAWPDQDSLLSGASVFFEDSVYLVRRTCSGEWGGSIWFKNKKSGVERSASATCPVAVNKVNGRYYVSSTLTHIARFAAVLEIRNPDSMSMFTMPKPRQKRGRRIVRHFGDDESKSARGTTLLADTVGILIVASFPYRNILYHVLTDFERVVVATIENGQFVTTQLVSENPWRSFYPTVFMTPEGHRRVFFREKDLRGHLDVFENEIKLVRYR